MNRESTRRGLSALAFGLVAICLAHAEDSSVTYDVRVFQVTKPITTFPFEGAGSGSSLLGLVQLQEAGWTVETGLPLNDAGDVLFWDGEKSDSKPGIMRLASENGVGNRKTVTIDSGAPLQYLEARADGRYELKTSEKGHGFSLTLACAGPEKTRVWFDNRLSAKRRSLPGVHLDVGEPQPSVWTNVIIRTPPEQWGDCIVLDTGRQEMGCLLVFPRRPGPPAPGYGAAAATPEEEIKREYFSVKLKFVSIPPKVDAKLSDAFRIDPAGSAFVKEICAPGKTQPFAKLDEVTDWLNSMEAVELLSSPRITMLSLRAGQANASNDTHYNVLKRPTEGDSIQKNSMLDDFLMSPIMRENLERLAKSGFSIIRDSFTFQTDTDGNITSDWIGNAVILTVDGCETPGTAILDFAAVHRYRAPDTSTPRDRVASLKRTGPEFERVSKEVPPPPMLESGIVAQSKVEDGGWRAYTTIEPGTGNRLLLLVEVRKVDATGAKFAEPGKK